MLHFWFWGFLFWRKTSFTVKRMHKLCFLFLGMKKRSNLQAFTDKLLVFQQHKTAVRLKYKNGRERRFCLALANHVFPKTILYFIHVQQSFSSHSFLVLWGFLVLFWLFFLNILASLQWAWCVFYKQEQTLSQALTHPSPQKPNPTIPLGGILYFWSVLFTAFWCTYCTGILRNKPQSTRWNEGLFVEK